MGAERQADIDGPSASLRIGDVARIVGTTPRTIRYYEEIGLLPGPPDRIAGGHRVYTEAEVDRLVEVMRLRNLLGVSLDELKTLLHAEEARAALRAELRRENVGEARRRELLKDALGHLELQLELVNKRADELARLKTELTDKRKLVRRKLRELGAGEVSMEPVESRDERGEARVGADTRRHSSSRAR
jgi:DNA-binding transcriptional MerR regulator